MRVFPTGVFGSTELPPVPAVRGVVVGGPYFADDQAERETSSRQRDPNFYQVTNVAVDVITYGGKFRSFLAKVPIVPQRHALNDYTGLWIPRAATMDLRTGGPAILTRDDGTPSDPKDLDGDHVLVEFLELDPSMPFIRNQLPHPRTSYRQVRSSGPSLETRFRGVVVRVDEDGDVMLDTTRANGGDVVNDPSDAMHGQEPPSDDNAHGHVNVRVARDTSFNVVGVDSNGDNEAFRTAMSAGNTLLRLNDLQQARVEADGTDTLLKLGREATGCDVRVDEDGNTFIDVQKTDGILRISASRSGEVVIRGVDTNNDNETYSMRLSNNSFEVRLADGLTLQAVGNDIATTFQVGSGAAHVAIVEHLKTLYQALEAAYNTHTHTVASAGLFDSLAAQVTGSATAAPPAVSAPTWDPAIESTRVSIPEG